MNTPILDILHTYTRSDEKLGLTGNSVKQKFYYNTAFPEPPVAAEDFTVAYDNFQASRNQRKGPEMTAKKNEYAAVFREMMRKNAAYALEKSNNDLATLLSSGYEVASTTRTREQLEAPVYRRVRPGLDGSALSSVGAVRNSRGYEQQMAEILDGGGLGEWITAPFASDSRALPTGPLVPGKLYALRVRALGGLTGHSEWSGTTTYRAV